MALEEHDNDTRAQSEAVASPSSKPVASKECPFDKLSAHGSVVFNNEDSSTEEAPAWETPTWMEGIMNSVDILISCGDDRPDYDGLRAAATLYDISQGNPPGTTHFPTLAELGEAAELLDLSGVHGWDHLVGGALQPERGTSQNNRPADKTSPNKRSASRVAFAEEAVLSKRARLDQENQPRGEEEVLLEQSTLPDEEGSTVTSTSRAIL